MGDRHHPRKRVAQYSRALRYIAGALEYWVARSSLVKPGDDGRSTSLQFFELQIALSDAHSTAVSSGGPLGG
jgi:hypothetical protein